LKLPLRVASHHIPESELHPGLNARLAAAKIIRDIILNGMTLDKKFPRERDASELSLIDCRDHALVLSIVTTTFRRFGTINEAIVSFLKKGIPPRAADVKWILVVAAAQVLFLEIPDHAAVDLAVKAVKLEPKYAFFAPVVNAVLRNLIRQKADIISKSNALEIDTPAWLAQRWKNTYGDAAAKQIALSNREEPTLDLTVKNDAATWAKTLDAKLLATGSLRLETHRSIQALEGYEEGEWWIQDAAAAIPAKLIGAKPGMRVADLCAAPGGKAAQLAMFGADVTAVDRSAERLKVLASNFKRLRLQAEIIVGDATKLSLPPFDAILVDAPCSATGTIRRHPDIAWTKKPQDIGALTQIQKQILENAGEMLNPGGTLIYCTCSIEPEEGEEQIEEFLLRRPEFIRFPIKPEEIGGLTEILNSNGEIRSLPFHLKGESPRQSGLDGFFIGRLSRRS